jgi:predicted TIM-barrel fold metal-dependent hydrolase
MIRRMLLVSLLVLVGTAAAVAARAAAAQVLPLFDAHLHYNAEARSAYPVEKALEIFRKNGVMGILANSRPNDGTRALYEAKPKDVWVVPFVRPYVTRDDIPTWFKDPKIRAMIESEMKRGYYRGVGEFHLYAADARHEGVKRIVELAVAHGFVLHAHSDDDAIEALFSHNPKAKVIWAHTGFGTSPEKVEAYLKRYPALWCELSYRYGLTDGSGRLTPEFRRLFETYPERFLIGSDTWVTERWDGYAGLMAGYRAWLGQLPRDVAEKIAYRNAERLFREH